ncbi:lamin tail domain-containing protein [Planotetraspora thailandica]|uniref:lamin tail domain-containing protein n=1 Tax=Planotetraspora thailandica TaxID=487172 RepID=UPI001950C732|nr:lamin tail domain-containing protein [Planotetraspora thailandica]
MKINEVESNGGTPGDWVELVNTGAAPVDVSGWVVKDNDDSHAFTIAAGTTMGAGAFLALDVDPVFGLGSADSARLYLADGTTLVDSYTWTAHAATTYGRCPDGTGAFVTTTSSTKGAANDCGSPSSVVKINEVESNGGTPGDWVELVNTGAVPVDVSGWVVKDNDDTHVFTIAAGTTVAAGAFLALDVEAAFGLGSADSARLYLADGTTLVDSYTWTAHAATTYGRCPDGTGAFVTTTAPTKGAANDCGTPSSVVKINEVESNGGTPGDWVELVNTGAAPVDVSGWIVKDNDDTHVFTVAAGTTMAAGGFLALDVDPVFGLGSADSARLYLPDGTTLVDSYSWTSHAATTYGRCPDGSGAFVTTTAPTKGAANDCGTPSSVVKINEVESDGGTPGDWVELVNTGVAAVDVSGWVVKDNDDTHAFTIAAGTTMAAGAFLALDVDPVFGLGGADSARLFLPGGTTLVDSYSWTSHAATTYGRCPDGTGQFVTTTAPTKGAANACPGQVSTSPWPGGAAVATADDANVFGTNMSGLAYEASGGATPGVLWAVKNGPGTLYRLEWDGTKWTPSTTDGWNTGKQLHYPDGTGDPDSEGVTLTAAGLAGGVFVSTERDNGNSGVSRPEVLRFDPSGTAAGLTATKEWNLTADLPAVGANSGLEAISWVPDSFLTSHGFVDEHTGKAYDPGSYPGHGDGLFFVGLEANGTVYAYALDQNGGGFTRVATIATGFPGVMDLQFEPETNHLWAVCDDTCNGRTATLDIDADGKFTVSHVYERPGSMANLNNEGFAIAPQAECVDGHKPVFWSDDSNDDGHALRSGTLDCTVVDLDADDDGIDDDVDVTFPPGTSHADDPANQTFSDAVLGGTTSGSILSRGGRTLTVSDAHTPGGILVNVGAGSVPAQFQLAGSGATIKLGRGSYKLTGSGKTSTVTTVDGEQAVVTVSVNGTPITLTVGEGGSVTYTEASAGGKVTGLSGIRQTGTVSVRADGVPATACTGIAIENVIVATTGNNQISGTAGDDLILGRGGNDTVNGNGGSDCVVTGSGNDTITTAGGDDWIDAGGGNNVVRAGAGANTVATASGNDQITTGDGDDTVNAGGGNNTVTTGGGNDAIATGSGNDTVDCGAGSDAAQAGGGNNANVGTRCETFGR